MPAKKSWKDLSTTTKIRIAIMGMIQVALLAAALWDLRHRSADEIRGDKRIWYGVAFINYFGPIAYFVYGRKPPATMLEATAN